MVGGDVDPRTGKYWFTENARDWVSDDLPSDKLNVINKIGEHFGYPIATKAICRTRNSPWVTSARNLPRLRSISADMSPPWDEVLHRRAIPRRIQELDPDREHGSWNRHKYQGGRIVRVTVGPDGRDAKQEVFASGWVEGDRGYLGRPDDIILAKDGSILVVDGWAGAIYRISYKNNEARKNAAAA